MKSRKQYVLGDFTKYSSENFAGELAAVADLNIYKFAEKVYLDSNEKIQRVHMLLVGHYSRKSGGPPVWAHANESGVRYYSGSGLEVTPLVQDIHSSRVYYDRPFSLMGGAQYFSDQNRGMTPERKHERALVEAVVNFIFLTSGRLAHVADLDNPNMLSNFKSACRIFTRHRQADSVDNALQEQPGGTQARNAELHTQAQPLWSANRTARLAHRDGNSSFVTPAKRSFVDLSDDVSETPPYGSNKRALSVEQPKNDKTELHAKLEREVQSLKAQLAEQAVKISTTEAKLLREKTKRRAAKEQHKELRRMYDEQENTLGSAGSQDIKQEEENQDWKHRLFEQERKTENYKVRYIELKEERKQWKAQSLECEKNIQAAQFRWLERKQHAIEADTRNARQRETNAREKTAYLKLRQELEEVKHELELEREKSRHWQDTHSNLARILQGYTQSSSAPPPNAPRGPRSQAPSTGIHTGPRYPNAVRH